MPVSHIREELEKLLPEYQLIADCIDGDNAVKARGQTYLPKPTLTWTAADQERYKQYIARAIFYNVTKRTLHGLVGQIYIRDPVIEVPDILDPVIEDATGSGISLVQLTKDACRKTIGFGRCGLFVDYPKTNGEAASRAELAKGKIRPTIYVYAPEQVINWRVKREGADEFFTLVVLEEEYILNDDGFEETKGVQWRVLRLNETGFYIQEIYREAKANIPFETIMPLDARGEPLMAIPFLFIGSENNDSEPDNPPMYDMSVLNVGHYRNSADYEESSFICGQPTPVLIGLTEDWIKEREQFKNNTIFLGSRTAIPLPEGGNALLLQAAPNMVPYEAMQHKERQMVALGAKLVEERTVQRTATEASQEQSTELSVLSSVSQNVSNGFTVALQWCAIFVGVAEEGISFELSNQFDLAKMSPEERRQTVEEWVLGAITFSEMRESLRKGGIATLDVEEAQKTIEKEQEERMKREEEKQRLMVERLRETRTRTRGPTDAISEEKVK